MTKMRRFMRYLCLLVIAICYCTSLIDHLPILFDMNGNFSLVNYRYLGSGKYLIMTLNSVWYAF